jgi:glucosamine-6-phosphate deaminase
VPTHALTMTIPALLSAKRVLVVVPDARKADAIRGTVLGEISTACPASILRRHAHVTLFLDAEAASKIGKA